ncbi:30S ribosomal protein 3, chloroplastic [Capsicum baccatum]|uniref:30S ribosomal protein 3, chloroplastic n=1 Tax=Capsicum baccatum TaxID=33114 RepID=A0A2G2VK36_CAPBA|nr:30S ribosomal protein 3, chloroplastic [Capsicum annuum]PHT33336.1 30S ribosomal protein 3, chloroplastic [Capsicum baccatum]
MLSMSVQCSLKTNLSIPSLPSQNPSYKSFKSCSSFTLNNKKTSSKSRIHRLFASAVTETETEPVVADTSESSVQEIQKSDMKKKVIEKPRLVLKFIWMEKNIGLGLDQVLPDHGSVPLSPYFFWPRKDAWEELKTTLESKPWISQKQMIILLNQATDIINLWQQSGGNLS